MAGHEIAEVTGELVPVVLFVMIGVIVVGNRYFRHKERTQMQDTLRAAYERGQTVQPELLAMMTTDPRPLKPTYGPERDLRRGLFWIAWALALLAAGGARPRAGGGGAGGRDGGGRTCGPASGSGPGPEGPQRDGTAVRLPLLRGGPQSHGGGGGHGCAPGYGEVAREARPRKTQATDGGRGGPAVAGHG